MLTEEQEDIGYAMTYLHNMYKRITSSSPILRLRNNLVHYDLHQYWVLNTEDQLILLKLIHKISKKFGDVVYAFLPYLHKIQFEINLNDACMSSEITWHLGYLTRLEEESSNVIAEGDFIDD
jgi:hypothetical protein